MSCKLLLNLESGALLTIMTPPQYGKELFAKAKANDDVSAEFMQSETFFGKTDDSISNMIILKYVLHITADLAYLAFQVQSHLTIQRSRVE